MEKAPQTHGQEPDYSETISEARDRLARFDGPGGPEGDRSDFDFKNAEQVAREAGFDSVNQVGDDRRTLQEHDDNTLSEADAAAKLMENAEVAKRARKILDEQERIIMYGAPKKHPKKPRRGGNNRHGDSFRSPDIPFGLQ